MVTRRHRLGLTLILLVCFCLSCFALFFRPVMPVIPVIPGLKPLVVLRTRADFPTHGQHGWQGQQQSGCRTPPSGVLRLAGFRTLGRSVSHCPDSP